MKTIKHDEIGKINDNEYGKLFYRWLWIAPVTLLLIIPNLFLDKIYIFYSSQYNMSFKDITMLIHWQNPIFFFIIFLLKIKRHLEYPISKLIAKKNILARFFLFSIGLLVALIHYLICNIPGFSFDTLNCGIRCADSSLEGFKALSLFPILSVSLISLALFDENEVDEKNCKKRNFRITNDESNI